MGNIAQQNADTYPYWYPPPEQRPAPLGAQDTRERERNRIPSQDEYRQDSLRVVNTPAVFQDSRRPGQGDEERVAVGSPGFLFQYVMDSPILKQEGKT